MNMRGERRSDNARYFNNTDVLSVAIAHCRRPFRPLYISLNRHHRGARYIMTLPFGDNNSVTADGISRRAAARGASSRRSADAIVAITTIAHHVARGA